jgi:FtsH-binding integral membrane protein
MSEAMPAYRPVATLDDTARGEFLVRVYQHLAAALIAFIAFEALLFNLGAASRIYDFVASAGYVWLLLLGAFWFVSWMATSAAHDILNPQRQYLGLFGISAAWAVIFAPMLYYFFRVADDGSTDVWIAAAIAGAGFAGLSGVAMATRRDLSFLRPLLLWGFALSMLLILAGIFFGLALGVWFSVAMIGLAGASILYQTQTIIRRYPAEAYVGASVQLFASAMLLFWYVLRLVGARR